MTNLFRHINYYFLIAIFTFSCASPLSPPWFIEILSKEKIYTLKAEIASSEQERQRGLMYRASLPEDSAMVFLIKPARKVNMWMKNTVMPLDMLFISEGTIVHIKQHAIPMSTAIIPSIHAVDMVVEVAAGTVTKYQLQVGELATVQLRAGFQTRFF